jgi:hypothetical protein
LTQSDTVRTEFLAMAIEPKQATNANAKVATKSFFIIILLLNRKTLKIMFE